jgi:hypothetical protein
MPAKKADPDPEPSLELPLESPTEVPAELQALSAAAAALALSSEPVAPPPYSQQRALDRIAEAVESQSIALSMMADVLQQSVLAQQSIAAMLAKPAGLVEGLDKVQFGFGKIEDDASSSIVIDCRSHTQLGSLWAIYNGKDPKGRPMPKTAILEERLVCNLIGLRPFDLPLASGKVTEKLALLVEAGGVRYQLVAGLRTGSETHNFNNWTGCILQACARATDEQLRSPWAISPKMGSKLPKPRADGTQAELPIFANIGAWDGSKFVEIDTIGEPSLSEYKAIIDRVNTILGYLPRGQQSNDAGDEAMDEAVDRFIDWKTEGSPLWDEAKNMGWTQPVVMQFLADQGCTFEDKGSFKGVTKSKLDAIRDMLLDREVLNEYAGVNPLAGAGGGF